MSTAHDHEKELSKEELPKQGDEGHEGHTVEAANTDFLQGALAEVGIYLRERAHGDTRQAVANHVLSQLPPEEQKKFIEDSQGWIAKGEEAILTGLTGGLYDLYKLIMPSFTDKEKAELSTFKAGELKAYIAIGAVEVDESVATLVDHEFKDSAKWLELMALLVSLAPGIGPEIGKILSEAAHIAKVPAELAIKLFPGVRATVRAKSVIPAALATEYGAIANGLEPEVELAA